MNEIVRAGKPRIDRLPGHRVIFTGTTTQVSAALVEVDDRGLLVSYGALAPTGLPGEVAVTAKLRPPAPPPREAPAPFWTPRRLAYAGGAALAVVATICAAGLLALNWLADHWQLVVGGALVAVLALGLATRAGGRFVEVFVRVRVRG